MTWTYIQFVLILIAFAGFLAKRAPVSVIVTLWFLMMCWEAYDLHPDHVVVYSAVFGYATYKAVHRPVTAKTRVRT